MTLFKPGHGLGPTRTEDLEFPRYIIYRGYPDFTFGTHLLEHIGNGEYVSRASGELADIKILKESLESK